MRPREMREKLLELEAELTMAQSKVDGLKADIEALKRVQKLFNGGSRPADQVVSSSASAQSPASHGPSESDPINAAINRMTGEFGVHEVLKALALGGASNGVTKNQISTRLIRLMEGGALDLVQRGQGRRPSIYRMAETGGSDES